MNAKLVLLFVFLCLPLTSYQQDVYQFADENFSNNLEQEIRSRIARDCSFSVAQITQFNIPFFINNRTNNAIASTFNNITPTTNILGNNVVTNQNFVTNSSANNTLASNLNNPFNAATANVFLPNNLIANTIINVSGNNNNNPQGLYCVAPNFSPQVTNNPQLIGKVAVPSGTGITISTSNVIIDFNDTVLLGVGGSIGILITGGVSNIIIRNGTISNMSVAGITINNGNSSLSGPILIENMRFFNNGTAINALNAFNLVVQNCRSYFATTSGFLLNQVTNCFVNNCISNGNTTQGFNCLNSSSVLFVNCQSENNTLNGFNVTGIAGSQFIKCVANRNQSGFFITNGTVTTQNNNFFECDAAQNSFAGFSLTGNLMNIENCSSLGNTNGFICSGNSINIEDAVASDNTINGFQITGNFCQANLIQANNNTSQGIQINGNCNAILNSEVKNNQGSGFILTGTGSTIQNCIACDNGINGIAINGSNHTILNCVSKQQNGGTGISGNGILLANASNNGPVATDCQVRNNTVTGNTLGINNNGINNRIYSNFANNNVVNYNNVPNVVISPTAITPINFTANIAE